MRALAFGPVKAADKILISPRKEHCGFDEWMVMGCAVARSSSMPDQLKQQIGSPWPCNPSVPGTVWRDETLPAAI